MGKGAWWWGRGGDRKQAALDYFTNLLKKIDKGDVRDRGGGRGMAHTGADGSRTIDVLCTRCSNVVRIRQEPDAHGREKALLRTELARLHGDLDRIGEEFEDFKTRSDLARTVDAGRFAVFAAKILEKGVDSMRTVEEMSEELDEIRRQAAAAVPGAECRAGDPEQAALIGGMEAKMSKLEAALRYYETPNSRRGMPSLYDKEAKKFDKGMAESCSRPMPEARRGPPMGHLGAPHSLKPEKTIDCPAPAAAPTARPPSRRTACGRSPSRRRSSPSTPAAWRTPTSSGSAMRGAIDANSGRGPPTRPT